jgi:hypothetical protein
MNRFYLFPIACPFEWFVWTGTSRPPQIPSGMNWKQCRLVSSWQNAVNSMNSFLYNTTSMTTCRPVEVALLYCLPCFCQPSYMSTWSMTWNIEKCNNLNQSARAPNQSVWLLLSLGINSQYKQVLFMHPQMSTWSMDHSFHVKIDFTLFEMNRNLLRNHPWWEKSITINADSKVKLC